MSGAKRGLRASDDTNEGDESMASCPECGAEIDAGDVEQGEILPCPECGAELEVVSVAPVTLALAPEEGEDWGE